MNEAFKKGREHAQQAYDPRHQAIGRIGLKNVRDHRRKGLEAGHEARMAQLDAVEACAALMLRVGNGEADAS